MNIVTRIRALVVALVVVLGGLVATASPASAHHPTVQGQAVCDTETGLFDITWTVGNSERDKVMTFTSRLGGGTVQPNPATATLTEDDLEPGTYSLTVDGSWPNGVKQSATGEVTAGGDCEPPAPECPEGSEPSGYGCVQVEDKSETGAPDCEAGEITTTFYERSRTFELVDQQWVPGEWSEWEVVDETTTPVEEGDCDTPQPPKPEPVVDQGQDRRVDCVGVERRSWTSTTDHVWNEQSGEWELGEPVIERGDWTRVRTFTLQEKVARGCVEVEGEQETDKPRSPAPGTPSTSGGASAVPTVVAAGV